MDWSSRSANAYWVLSQLPLCCPFTNAFEHVLGRHAKQEADNHILTACLIAWATNMGLGRMGEISDISFHTLRPQTILSARRLCVKPTTVSATRLRSYRSSGITTSAMPSTPAATARNSKPAFIRSMLAIHRNTSALRKESFPTLSSPTMFLSMHTSSARMIPWACWTSSRKRKTSFGNCDSSSLPSQNNS